MSVGALDFYEKSTAHYLILLYKYADVSSFILEYSFGWYSVVSIGCIQSFVLGYYVLKI